MQEADLVRLKREAKAKNGFYVEAEAKLMFVVRIRGLNKIHPKVQQGRQHTAGVLVAHGPFQQRWTLTIMLFLVSCRPRRSCSCCACARSTMASS